MSELIGDGDLTVTDLTSNGGVEAAASLFEATGVVVFERAVPRASAEAAAARFAPRLDELVAALTARGAFAPVAWPGAPRGRRRQG